MFRYNIKFGITTLQIYKIDGLHITQNLAYELVQYLQQNHL